MSTGFQRGKELQKKNLGCEQKNLKCYDTTQAN